MMRSVELVPAHLWVCDECGRDNFERARRVESGSAEHDELMAELDDVNPKIIEEFAPEGEFLMAPTEVTCRHCGTSFRSEAGA